MKLRVQLCGRPSRSRGALPVVGGAWGVTARKASHNASNAWWCHCGQDETQLSYSSPYNGSQHVKSISRTLGSPGEEVPASVQVVVLS